jgi:Na+/proline symporter
VHGRYGSRSLELAVALTGLLATMPYIALQLVGIQVVLATMGITGTGIMADVPLIVAFVILAAYTYTSGLRAPAMIAVVKDTLIYITVIVAVIAIPIKLGGYGHIFAAAQAALAAHPKPASIVVAPAAFGAYASLALGSALALFLYPHSITGVLSSRNADVIRRNAAFLPAYSLMLGLIALLGYMALAAGISTKTTSLAVPLLFKAMFPSWFVGVAFAAIAIGALVPAAIMSIAAANPFTRNIWVRYVQPGATQAQESGIGNFTSLVVKLGALAFIILIPLQYAINLQLLGGMWILQTLPAIVFGLYTRWFHARALFVGWLAGMVVDPMNPDITVKVIEQLRAFGQNDAAAHALTALTVLDAAHNAGSVIHSATTLTCSDGLRPYISHRRRLFGQAAYFLGRRGGWGDAGPPGVPMPLFWHWVAAPEDRRRSRRIGRASTTRRLGWLSNPRRMRSATRSRSTSPSRWARSQGTASSKSRSKQSDRRPPRRRRTRSKT